MSFQLCRNPMALKVELSGVVISQAVETLYLIQSHSMLLPPYIVMLIGLASTKSNRMTDYTWYNFDCGEGEKCCNFNHAHWCLWWDWRSRGCQLQVGWFRCVRCGESSMRHAFAGFSSIYGGEDVDFDGATWWGLNDKIGLCLCWEQ
jgi:hypothetical protein